MSAITPEEARAYFNRWELVRDVEAAELRQVHWVADLVPVTATPQ